MRLSKDKHVEVMRLLGDVLRDISDLNRLIEAIQSEQERLFQIQREARDGVEDMLHYLRSDAVTARQYHNTFLEVLRRLGNMKHR